MQIVIDIPEEVYNGIISRGNFISDFNLSGAIANGTVFPEGHGKIVDLGNIDKDRIEQDNPVMTINIYGTAIEAVPLDYLYNLPDLINKDGE